MEPSNYYLKKVIFFLHAFYFILSYIFVYPNKYTLIIKAFVLYESFK